MDMDVTIKIIEIIIGPTIVALLGGLGYFGKWYLDSLEKKRADEIRERDVERQKIRDELLSVRTELEGLKKDLTYAQCLLFGCENPNCTSKKSWAEYLKKKMEETR